MQIFIALIVVVLILFLLWEPFKLLLRYVFYEMAKEDLLFTLRAEGEIKAIMKGDKHHHFIMAVENYWIDPDDFDIFKCSAIADFIKNLIKAREEKLATNPGFIDQKLAVFPHPPTPEERQKAPYPILEGKNGVYYTLSTVFSQHLREANRPTSFEKEFGVVWVGFPPYHVFSYQFRWIKYAQEQVAAGQKPSGVVKMNPRDENVKALYFRYPHYGIVIDDAETGAGSLAHMLKTRKGKKKSSAKTGVEPEETEAEEDTGLERIPLHIELVMETETTNPKKSLFRTAGLSSAGDWLQAIEKEIRDSVRVWVAEKDYDTFYKDKRWARMSLDSIRDRLNGLITEEIAEEEAEEETTPSISVIRDYGQKIIKLSLVNVDLPKELQDAINRIFKAEQDVRESEKEAQSAINRAKGDRAKAAAPVLGLADGFREIASITGGVSMYNVKSLGNIKVLTVGGGQSITSLPASLLEEPPTGSEPAKKPDQTPSMLPEEPDKTGKKGGKSK